MTAWPSGLGQASGRCVQCPAWHRSRCHRPTRNPHHVTRHRIDIRTGQKVFHNKFGEGKVLAVEGAGPDARAQVNFSRHGTKWLALSVARLTPIA